MTIRFVQQWNGYSPDTIVTLAGAEETRLIGLGYAVTDLDGPGNTPLPVTSTTNLTGEIVFPFGELTVSLGNLSAASSLVKKSSIGATMFDFSTLTGYSLASGTMELVAVDEPRIGKTGSSIKVTIPAGVTSAMNFPLLTSGIYNPNQRFSLIMENLTLATTGSAVFYMSVDNGFANYYNTNISFNKYGLQVFDAANSTTGAGNQWTITGAPTFSTIKDGRINFTAPAGEDLVVILHGIYSGAGAVPSVMFIHDDGVVSGFTELSPILAEYGYKAGFSIIRDLIGTANYLTTYQLDRLYEAGHDLIAHGQYALDTFGTAQLALDDIDYNRDYLINRGYDSGSQVYVWPNGAAYYSATDKTSLIDGLGARGVKSAWQASGYASNLYKGINAYLLPRYPINAAVNTTWALAELDKAIESGRTFCFMLHGIVASGAAGDQSNRADVQTIIDGVVTRVQAGTCQVITPSQANWLTV